MEARIKVVLLFSLDIDFEGSFLVWSWDFEEWGFLVGKGKGKGKGGLEISLDVFAFFSAKRMDWMGAFRP